MFNIEVGQRNETEKAELTFLRLEGGAGVIGGESVAEQRKIFNQRIENEKSEKKITK